MNEELELKKLQDCREILEAYMKIPVSKRDDFKKAVINIAELLADKNKKRS